MTISPRITDMTGNQNMVDGQTLAWDSMLNSAIPSATRPGVVCGTGAPTFTAPQGTLYLNITGSTIATRAYINTTGSTTWTAVTTVA